ncbi:MAG TPA: glycosyltransferase family 1 protein [Myxococcales bacterium]|nr:glycosyltransferase family 1 protein [Myxococcales bacterium]
MYVLDPPPLRAVGINAAPLLAPRTGVGRYIAGLLESLDAHPAPDLRCVPLFAPRAAAASGGGRALRAASLVRTLVKRLPASYELAQAARAALLAAHRDLRLYHETNHAAPRFRGPVVVTIHDLSTIRFPETQEAPRARHFARAMRNGTRDAARIVTPTDAIAREVVDLLRIPRERVHAIPHGVGPEFAPQGLRRSWPRPYVVYVGALNARKGLDTLAAAFASLPERIRREHDLLVAGPREPGAPDVRGATMLGYVADADLPPLLRGAAAFCYPSRYEGFGLPLLEAMACGVPCVASDDPALVEVAAGAALHPSRGDPGALAAAIERALDDQTLRADLSRRGPERASAFTWERSAREHLRLYREAMA